MKKNFAFFLLTWMSAMQIVFAQNNDLPTIHTAQQYKKSVRKNNEHALVNLSKLKGKINYDLVYATTHNFTKTNLYTTATTTYLRKPAAAALQQVMDSLAQLHLYVKVWDAYRPYAATKLMWDLIHDERYVANPKSGSNHNRGLAIDLTLVTAQGVELNMGTGFDNFTDTAHHSFKALPNEVLANRKRLKSIMEHYGFKALDTEWWHYSFSVAEKPMVIDLPFASLLKLVK